jgi:hypothetical protein
MLIVMNVSFGLPPLGTMLLSNANYFFRSSCPLFEKWVQSATTVTDEKD